MVSIEIVLLTGAMSLLSAVAAASLTHWMTRNRELEAKRRDIALTRLVDAWLALDAASDKPTVRDGDLKKLEDAIRTVVLFAEDSEIDLAEKVAKAMAATKEADFTDLQIALRQKIRTSMGIKGRKRHFWYAIVDTRKASSDP